MENLEPIKRDIAMARRWAREKFSEYINEEETPTNILASAALGFGGGKFFIIKFPDVDRMSVCPVAYGKRVDAGCAEFRLKWYLGSVFWVGAFSIRKEVFGVGEEISHLVGRAATEYDLRED